MGFRPDIQGVRGFALVLVLLCHSELPHAEGGFVGLDAFYVLSGFLITGLIVHEIERTGRLSLTGFYGRRAKRILPLAVTVLLLVVVCSAALFGPVRSFDVSRDVIASAGYFVNWHFVAQSVDYFAFDGHNISPVQHFWSLSVEEQFYLLWPLLIIAGAWWAKRSPLRLRPTLALLLVPVGLASFVYGVHFTHVSPDQAYFSTFSRGWELALGGALALVLPATLRLPRAAVAVLAAGGLASMVWMTVTFSDSTPYPGWWGLVPCLGTAAIIVAGTAAGSDRAIPLRFLNSRPLQYLGKISYASYLWHWPMLVFAAALWGDLSPEQRLLVTLVSFVPTVMTHHLIEERFRRSKPLNARPRRALALGLSCTAGALVVGVVLGAVQPTIPTAKASDVTGATAFAARSHRYRLQRSADAVRPNPRHANDDRGRIFADGCHLRGTGPSVVKSPPCVYGDRHSDKEVVMLGDSHGLMYGPAMLQIAKKHDWRYVHLTRAGCTSAAVDFKKGCDEWRRNTVRRIRRMHADVVVVSNATDGRFHVHRHGHRLSRGDSERYLEAGFARTLRRIKRSGAKVVVIRDIAEAPLDVPDCVAGNLHHLRRCAFHPHRSWARAYDVKGARRVRHVKIIDPQDVLCPHRLCAAVMGNALVYRNDYHLSATFSRTLAPWLYHKLPKPRHHQNRKD